MKKNRRCGGFSLKLVLRYQQTNSIPLESNLWSRCPPPCSDLDSDRAEPLKYSERNITHAYFTSSGDLSLSERENKTVRISHPARRSSNITAEKEEARPQTLRLFFFCIVLIGMEEQKASLGFGCQRICYAIPRVMKINSAKSPDSCSLLVLQLMQKHGDRCVRGGLRPVLGCVAPSWWDLVTSSARWNSIIFVQIQTTCQNDYIYDPNNTNSR